MGGRASLLSASRAEQERKIRLQSVQGCHPTHPPGPAPANSTVLTRVTAADREKALAGDWSCFSAVRLTLLEKLPPPGLEGGWAGLVPSRVVAHGDGQLLDWLLSRLVLWGPAAQLRSTALGLPAGVLRGPFLVTSLHANGQFRVFKNNIY